MAVRTPGDGTSGARGVDRSVLQNLIGDVARRSLDERREIVALPADRADIILAGPLGWMVSAITSVVDPGECAEAAREKGDLFGRVFAGAVTPDCEPARAPKTR